MACQVLFDACPNPTSGPSAVSGRKPNLMTRSNGRPAYLVPEPGNPRDANALCIRIKNHLVGYPAVTTPSSVLSGLPSRHADKCDVGLASSFWSLPQTWPAPADPRLDLSSCVAQKLRSGVCWTMWKAPRTCAGLTLPPAGVAGLKNACSKARTVKSSTRTRWADSKATSNSIGARPHLDAKALSPSTTPTFRLLAFFIDAWRPASHGFRTPITTIPSTSR